MDSAQPLIFQGINLYVYQFENAVNLCCSNFGVLYFSYSILALILLVSFLTLHISFASPLYIIVAVLYRVTLSIRRECFYPNRLELKRNIQRLLSLFIADVFVQSNKCLSINTKLLKMCF